MKRKAEQLAEIITEQILNGEYPRNTALPPERKLAIRYNTSRVTMRKVLQFLNSKKIIYRKTPRKYFTMEKLHDKFTDFQTSGNSGNVLNIAFVMHPRWSHHTVFHELYSYLKKELPPGIGMRAWFDSFLQPESYLQNNVKIIIADHGFRDEELAFAESKGLETMVLLRDRENGNYLNTDDVAGGYLCGKFLAEHGHRKIVCFQWGHEKSECNIQRRGFLKAAAAFDLIPIEVTIDPQSAIRSPSDAVEYLLKRNIDFSCVLAPDDEHALNIISSLHQAKLNVPDDIGVFGYGDIYFAREAALPLTTVRKPLPLMASWINKALKQYLEHGKLKLRKKIIPELIIRSSVK